MEELEISEEIKTTDPTFVWKACLLKIKENVSMMTYNTWFLPIKPVELHDMTLKVQIPSQFFWEWIDEHFNAVINRTITDVLGKDAKLTYIIAEDKSSSKENNNSTAKILPSSNQTDKPKVKHNFESNLNTRYTFDNFIKGEGNQLARAAAGAISDNPGGTSFNP